MVGENPVEQPDAPQRRMVGENPVEQPDAPQVL